MFVCYLAASLSWGRHEQVRVLPPIHACFCLKKKLGGFLSPEEMTWHFFLSLHFSGASWLLCAHLFVSPGSNHSAGCAQLTASQAPQLLFSLSLSQLGQTNSHSRNLQQSSSKTLSSLSGQQKSFWLQPNAAENTGGNISALTLSNKLLSSCNLVNNTGRLSEASPTTQFMCGETLVISVAGLDCCTVLCAKLLLYVHLQRDFSWLLWSFMAKVSCVVALCFSSWVL